MGTDGSTREFGWDDRRHLGRNQIDGTRGSEGVGVRSDEWGGVRGSRSFGVSDGRSSRVRVGNRPEATGTGRVEREVKDGPVVSRR